jgi:hypothetical protein
MARILEAGLFFVVSWLCGIVASCRLTTEQYERFVFMSTDNPDTMPLNEATRWSETHQDDVFAPAVRVTLAWKDVEEAVEQGAVLPSMAHTLWAYWATPGSPTRVVAASRELVPAEDDALPQPTANWAKPVTGAGTGVGAGARGAAAPSGPRFSFTNTLYYFGGMLAIGAMSLFMTLGWASFGAWGLLGISAAYLVACLMVADHLKGRQLPVPAGILATLAVVLVPLVVWCAQQLMGLWPPGGPENYAAYHTHINWRWITLEFATLAAGVVMLWRYRLPFMVMPVAVTLWYMSMDLASALMQNEGFNWEFSRDVSLVFGLATCAIAVWVDLRCRASREPEWRQDFAFWLYLFGALMFWGGLSLSNSGSEWGKIAYAGINLVMVFVGAAIGRRVFTVLGALGVAGYLGYLSYRVFEDSMMFPFVLTLLGLGVVALGIWWQRHEDAIHASLSAWVPAALRGGVAPLDAEATRPG